MSLKMAAFNGFIHRLRNMPMAEEDFDEEFKTITYIAIQICYSDSIVDKLYKKTGEEKQSKDVTETKDQFLLIIIGNLLKIYLETRSTNKQSLTKQPTVYRVINENLKKDKNDKFEGTKVYELYKII